MVATGPGRGRGAACALLLTLAAVAACSGRSTTTPSAAGGLGGEDAAGVSGAEDVGPGLEPATGSAGTSQGGGAGQGGSGGLSSGGTGGTGGMGGIIIDDFGPQFPRNQFGFSLMSAFVLLPCLEVVDDRDCRLVLGECPNKDAEDPEQRGYRFAERFEMVGGEPDQVYLVSLMVNGVVEAKQYYLGARRAGDDIGMLEVGSDAWHVDGVPSESSNVVYKLTVLEPDGTTKRAEYLLNSFPQSVELRSYTYPISYEATIELPTGGIIELSAQDPDCVSSNNCGTGGMGVGCAAARNVPNEPGLAVPSSYGGKDVATLNVAGGAQQPFHAQIIHLSVTDVELAPK